MVGRPRIKDIAAAVGVSPASVSRALSGTGLVAEPTLSRIRAVAEDLGYRPDVRARNLRTRRSMAVLMVVRDVGNPFYLEIFKGVEAAAREAGYSVLMGNTEDDPDREAEYFDMLDDGHADGMILMTGKLPTEARGDLPVVVALEMIAGTAYPHVVIDNEAAGRAATQHLIDLGHRRIAHVTGPLPDGMSAGRLRGYRAAMAEAGLPVPDGYVARGDYSLRSGQAACRALMALPEPPTAIFAASDEMAYGIIGVLGGMGLSVPAEVSVMGFDDLFLSEAFQPPLSTVCQPRAEIGRKAMTVLIDVMAGQPAPDQLIVLPTELQIRGTTAPPAREKETPR